jgi:hypothetical protein
LAVASGHKGIIGDGWIIGKLYFSFFGAILGPVLWALEAFYGVFLILRGVRTYPTPLLNRS